MKKIYKKSQLLEVNNIPTEVIEGIKMPLSDEGGVLLCHFSPMVRQY